MAVAKKLQGNGIGTQLVDYAIAIIKTKLMPYVGCRYVILDAKEDAVKFYQSKFGFILLTKELSDDNTFLMLLDLHDVALPASADIEIKEDEKVD